MRCDVNPTLKQSHEQADDAVGSKQMLKQVPVLVFRNNHNLRRPLELQQSELQQQIERCLKNPSQLER